MDEIMFKRLLLAGDDDGSIEELIELGYFKKINGTVCRTNKYQDETNKFITSKKELLYEAIKKLGSTEDIQKVMKIAGIQDYVTFVFIAEELIQDGKLINSQGNKWTVKA